MAAMGATLILFGFAGFLQTWLSRAVGSTSSDGPPAPDDPNRPGTPKSLAMASSASYEQGLLPFLKKYCVDCHGAGAHSGDFSFERYRSVDELKRDRHVWTKALKLLKIEAMPPADADPPPPEERAQAAKWLDHQLFYVDCSLPQDPGRVTLRRLNKTEYNNTIRDLLGIDFQPANDFPSDDTGHGFDNIGDVLTIPPLLLEKYLDAAEAVAVRAIRTQPPVYSRTLYSINPQGHVRDLIQGKVLIANGEMMPKQDMNAADAARVNLNRFLPRAFRREVPTDECERYVALVHRALDHGDSFIQAMNMAVQAVLVSPHFLFRVEAGRRREGKIEMLDDFALASRLSYFVWASMPDEELFRLAHQNLLHEPDQLKAQTLRLLNDARANALVTSFASQWLGLRRLASSDVKPDAAQFPGFNDELRQDLRQETELFVGSIMRANRSIYELLNGRYTFLNERLARHYGIKGISGPEFRRVDFKEEKRAGVVTQGSFLTLTSHPGRTSPVRRGEWVLANLLGDAPPAPPPNVPALEQTRAANQGMTLRQQMERHRADPNCASCHKVMDAIGFGLESFDPVGRWRDRDGSHPIDSKGALPSGEVFDGPIELAAILNQRKAEFSRCLTEKMLTYALGRGVEWYDKCAVDDIVSQLKEDDRFSTLILGIVNTSAFQMRRVQKPLP
jgi:mono/diheme cytochrome c family protein